VRKARIALLFLNLMSLCRGFRYSLRLALQLFWLTGPQ
jgi:hypothetical protein